MNKNLLKIVIMGMAFVSTMAFSQTQLDNPDFETWDDLGATEEEPQNWNSFMSADCSLTSIFCDAGQIQRVERSTDTRPGSTGSYSARIWSTSAAGIIANGNLTTGTIHMGSTTATHPDNYNYTSFSGTGTNQSFIAQPDSMIFWVKFNPVNNGDLGRVNAVIHDNYEYRDPNTSDPASPNHIVGKAEYNFPTTNGNWQRQSIAFDYASHPATNPAYMLLTFTTNMTGGGGSANDEVFIDDISFKYIRTEIAPTTTQNLIINQSGTMLTATDYDATAVSREWKYTTTSGSGYTSFGTAETGTTYTPNFASGDVYYVVCETNFGGGLVKTSNEVQVNVLDNSIAPTTTQNIDENVAGTQLTVTETAPASSREWKYTTTSGSGYTSFGSAETGTNYTPLFATAGTYYVVCESTNAGGTVTSNEVEIIVSAAVLPTVSISPTATQNLLINEDGNVLTANEANGTVTSREWKYTTTSGSGYTSFGTAETNTTYTPNFASAGTYYVICETDFSGTIKTSNEVEIIVTTPTVSIAPVTTQNIDENVAGTMLTATETPAGVSREWKYTTTSGSGYTSFGTSETGLTYAPMFASAGTYYVVCESMFAGSNTIISNEVEIVVSAIPNSVTISPNNTQMLEENETGSLITVTEAPSSATSRQWAYTTTSGSGYAAFTPAETGTTYTPMFANAGTYYVICASDFSGSTVVSNEVEIIVSTVSINEELNADVKVYSYNNNIVFDATTYQGENLNVEVINISGQSVLNTSLNSNERKNITTDLASGVYVVNITNSNVQKQVKLFIK